MTSLRNIGFILNVNFYIKTLSQMKKKKKCPLANPEF